MVWLRRLLALISSIVFILMVLDRANRYLTTPGLSIRQYEFVSENFDEQKITLPDRPYNDLTDGGMQAKLNLSNNLFQVTLLLSAALAGLLIAKDREAHFVLGKPPELIMFILAVLLLLLSFISHLLFLNEVAYLYFLAGKLFEQSRPSVPDITDSNVSFLLTYQLEYLLAGLVLASFTFFSAHVLTKRGNVKDPSL